MRRNTILFILLFPVMLFAQVNSSFYEHYTGLITEDLKLTADLVKLENSFSGYYYYEFKEGEAWIASKPIALDGQVDTQSEFVLNEFGDMESYFQGKLENQKLINGQWHNKLLKEAVDFTLKATYPNGSMPMKVIETKKTKYFENNKSKPSATFHISVLFPSVNLEQAVYHQLLQRIYHLIGFRGKLDNQKDIITALQDTYFKQFESSLANIQLDSFPQSFKWIKNIRTDVINNEERILCLQVETYAKTGQGEGSRVKKYLVFDIANNMVIKTKDLYTEDSKAQLLDILQEKIRTHYHIAQETQLTEAGFFQDSIAPTANFYVHPGGLGFYYNVYEIAPFSNGPTDLFIPWKDLKGILPEDSALQALAR